MSDEQPPSRNAPRKRWVDRISQLFSGEPHDLDLHLTGRSVPRSDAEQSSWWWGISPHRGRRPG